MNYDKLGRAYTTTEELCELLYKDPSLDLGRFLVEDWDRYNLSVAQLYSDLPTVKEYYPYPPDYSIDAFHEAQQSNWHMPEEYKNLDIAKWLLDQCGTQQELQRVGEELLLYQERDLFNLLQYLKYIIDTFRKNNIVWGVGRGSSVASYCLFLLGVHKINSMYYDLDIAEFLR